MKLSVTEDINGQKYVRMSDEKRRVTMTNQEAIKILDEYKHCFWDKLYEPICMAIKALEQEPSEDAISRQAVLEKQYRIDDSATLSTRDVVNVNDIEDLPSVNPQEPKTGHWIWIVDESPSTPVSPYELNWAGWACDCCREQPDNDSDWDDCDNPPKYNYCPNCGARMESEDKE